MTDRGRWEQGWPAKARESRGIRSQGLTVLKRFHPSQGLLWKTEWLCIRVLRALVFQWAL